MNDREAGWLALAAGIVLILVAVLADVLGYGPGEDSFGPGQIIVTIIGSALAGYGVWRLLRLRRDS
ncbi:MAG: hypothetical protein KJP22_08265 [Acidimicrobiia bacterium]|nr:hypothetical protein [Acidimicrobiia bacterium]MBT8193380.1 hypothetical protein [Acidimicrobiia bacterium]MBT8248481.1 hypothetical protein [Acidimicrobiia bacterium]NNF89306.1 hypothetical protein [Acidimicrobiia bacterium]NNJ47603.1 hypothetical protein [Acidimicrobiia bacterium]